MALNINDYDEYIKNYLSSAKIKELEDTQSVSYVLPDENLFFLTGYKVLQGQHKYGFLNCAKVIYNGKVKLIYYIERNKSLQTLLPLLTPAMFLTVIYNLLSVFKEVRSNGFIQCENIWLSPERIYIDPDDLRVFLLYLPLNTPSSPDAISHFENTIKKVILDLLFENQQINDHDTQEIRKEIFADKDTTLDCLQETLRSKGHPMAFALDLKSWAGSLDEKYGTGNAAPYIRDTTRTNKTTNPDTEESGATNKQHSLFAAILRRGAKSAPVVDIMPEKLHVPPSSYSDFAPQLALVSQNLPESIVFIINQPEFKIGKDAQAVDGVIYASPFVSSIHCKIVYRGKQHYIEDMNSKNQTFLNNVPITPHTLTTIFVGDNIKLANIEFKVETLQS